MAKIFYESAMIDQRVQKSWPAGKDGTGLWDGVPFWAQCFYSSVTMFMSHLIKSVDAQTLYNQYFDDIETEVGTPGIGEGIMKSFNLPLVVGGKRVRSGQFWAVHCAGVNAYFQKYGVQGHAVWADIPWDQAINLLKTKTPLVMGTRIPPSDGHIIFIAGFNPDTNCFIVKDPYGNGLQGYPNGASGVDLEYPVGWLQGVASWAPGTGMPATAGNTRVMWLE